MSTIDDLRAKLALEEEILRRVRPELDRLKIEIGPWIRAGSSGIPMAEPVEARRRYAELQSELWQARGHVETRRELGEAESRARAYAANIARYDAEIARIESAPANTPQAAIRSAEEVVRIKHYRDNDARCLALLGEPSGPVLEEAV